MVVLFYIVSKPGHLFEHFLAVVDDYPRRKNNTLEV